MAWKIVPSNGQKSAKLLTRAESKYQHDERKTQSKTTDIVYIYLEFQSFVGARCTWTILALLQRVSACLSDWFTPYNADTTSLLADNRKDKKSLDAFLLSLVRPPRAIAIRVNTALLSRENLVRHQIQWLIYTVPRATHIQNTRQYKCAYVFTILDAIFSCVSCSFRSSKSNSSLSTSVWLNRTEILFECRRVLHELFSHLFSDKIHLQIKWIYRDNIVLWIIELLVKLLAMCRLRYNLSLKIWFWFKCLHWPLSWSKRHFGTIMTKLHHILPMIKTA